MWPYYSMFDYMPYFMIDYGYSSGFDYVSIEQARKKTRRAKYFKRYGHHR